MHVVLIVVVGHIFFGSEYARERYCIIWAQYHIVTWQSLEENSGDNNTHRTFVNLRVKVWKYSTILLLWGTISVPILVEQTPDTLQKKGNFLHQIGKEMYPTFVAAHFLTYTPNSLLMKCHMIMNISCCTGEIGREERERDRGGREGRKREDENHVQ